MRPITMMLWAGLAGAVAGCATDGADDRLGEADDAITSPNFAFNALQFGSGSFARTAGVVSTATDNVTLEAWVRWDGGTAGMIAYNGNSSSSGFGLYARSSGAVSVLAGGVGWVDCLGCALPQGVWTHIAAERQGTLWWFFQNGVMRPATPAHPTLAFDPPVGQFAIGASPSGADSFNGAIDEVRFWNLALPPATLVQEIPVALFGNETGLVGYYRLDEGGGTTSLDAAAGHRTLTLHGSPIWVSSGATLSTGIAVDALQFTGAASGHASTVVTARTEDITLEAWVRWDGGTGAQAVFYNGDSSFNGYGLYLSGGGVSLLAGGVGWAGCDGCRLTPGVWASLAAVRSGGQWQIYQNGDAQTVTGATIAAVPPSGVFSIASSPAGGERLIGALDEVRVWGVARTAQQIADGYTVSLSGTEPDLIAYYRMDEGSGSIADDTAGNHPISLVNAPTWQTSGALLATAQP